MGAADVSIRGGIASISGNIVKVHGHVKIEDQPIDVKILGHPRVKTSVSGNIVQISGATLVTTVSGEPVTVSGNIVQLVNASGQCLCANISGDVVQISGQVVTTSMSGNIVQISGQQVEISGQPVTISGNIVQVVNASGQCLCTNISGGVSPAAPASPVLDFNSVINVEAGDSSAHTYTATGNFKLTRVEISAAGSLKIEVKSGIPASETTKMVAFTVDSNLIAQLEFSEELQLTSGQNILVVRTNRETQATDVYSTILGFNA